MSVGATTRKAGPFTGNGATTAFPFAFKVFQASDLLVVQTDNSTTPVDTTMTLTTDYTVTLNSNQDSNPGGTVNMVVAPPSGYLLTLGSQVTETQSTTLTNTGGFYPTVINSALDYLTILIQQISEKVSRALVMPFSTNASGQLPPVSPGSLLGWKADGTGIDNVGATGVGAGGIVATNMASGATGSALSTDTQAAATKATPVDADELPLFDSTTTPAFGLKKLTWANLKATIRSYLDTRYVLSGADATAANKVVLNASATLSLAAHSGKFLDIWSMANNGVITTPASGYGGLNCVLGPTGGSNVTLKNGTAAGNIYLPDGSVIAAGASMVLKQGAGYSWEVREFAGSLYVKQRIVITASNDATFADNSINAVSSSWVRSAMSAIATSAGFASSLGAAGYVKFPTWLGGWIIQWGTATLAAGVVGISFNISFPTKCTSVFGSHVMAAVASKYALGFGSPTVSGVNAYSDSTYTNGIVWVAIGY